MHRETQTQSDSESQIDFICHPGRQAASIALILHICTASSCTFALRSCTQTLFWRVSSLQFANEFLKICSLKFAKFVSREFFVERLSLLGVSLSHFPLFFPLLVLLLFSFAVSLFSQSLSLSRGPLFCISVSTLHLASAS